MKAITAADVDEHCPKKHYVGYKVGGAPVFNEVGEYLGWSLLVEIWFERRLDHGDPSFRLTSQPWFTGTEDALRFYRRHIRPLMEKVRRAVPGAQTELMDFFRRDCDEAGRARWVLELIP